MWECYLNLEWIATLCPVFLHHQQVGMLFEFRVDCDVSEAVVSTFVSLWECYLNLEWIATAQNLNLVN